MRSEKLRGRKITKSVGCLPSKRRLGVDRDTRGDAKSSTSTERLWGSWDDARVDADHQPTSRAEIIISNAHNWWPLGSLDSWKALRGLVGNEIRYQQSMHYCTFWWDRRSNYRLTASGYTHRLSGEKEVRKVMHLWCMWGRIEKTRRECCKH